MSYVGTIGAFFICSLILTISLQESACGRTKTESRPTTTTASPEKLEKVKNGLWGGQHIRLEVTDRGASIEYDCAHSTIDQPVELDKNNGFDVRGTYTREAGGPVRSDMKSDTHPARYTGQIEGKKMTLTVVLTDTEQNVGTFSLSYGALPRVTKCL